MIEYINRNFKCFVANNNRAYVCICHSNMEQLVDHIRNQEGYGLFYPGWYDSPLPWRADNSSYSCYKVD